VRDHLDPGRDPIEVIDLGLLVADPLAGLETKSFEHAYAADVTRRWQTQFVSLCEG
jgi:hypothetical protein